MKALLRLLVTAILVLVATPALAADKVAVLSFSSPNNVSRPELEQVRQWTRDAVARVGKTYATPNEMVSAEAAVRDGVADTSEEHVAAGKIAGAEWTVTARVERIDNPPATLGNGTVEEGYTTYRLEVEACQIGTGRVESLSREVTPDDATPMIGEMLALLLRPEGLANADIPWERAGVPRPKPKPVRPAPPPPAPPPPVPVPAPPPLAPPEPRLVYGAGAPFAVGFAMGVTDAASTPSVGRGPTTSMTVGGTLGYALPDVAPGLEIRGNVMGQAVGPKAVEVSAGARYAFAPFGGLRLFVGPELLLGAHVASGADRTVRFLTHGSAFVAYGITTNIQVEAAGELAGAFGGPGSLLLVGGTGRVVLRF